MVRHFLETAPDTITQLAIRPTPALGVHLVKCVDRNGQTRKVRRCGFATLDDALGEDRDLLPLFDERADFAADDAELVLQVARN